MNNRTPRNAFITLIAMAAAAATPLAFAQTSSMTTQDDVQQSAMQQQAQVEAQSRALEQQRDDAAQPATGAATQSAQQTGAASGQGQQGWADVDTDSNGTISKQEATANAGLTQIFDQADNDKNGELTPDEYKSFISKNYGGAAGGAGQQPQQPQQSPPGTQH